ASPAVVVVAGIIARPSASTRGPLWTGVAARTVRGPNRQWEDLVNAGYIGIERQRFYRQTAGDVYTHLGGRKDIVGINAPERDGTRPLINDLRNASAEAARHPQDPACAQWPACWR